MKKIKDLLETKGREIWSITPDAAVYDAVDLMSEKDIGALVVMQNNIPVGIFSERDYARKIVLEGKSSKKTKVSEIMTSSIVFANTEQSVEDCMALMTEKRFRHLPILEGDKLVAVISIGDLVKAIIEEQKFVIEQLESYIAS